MEEFVEASFEILPPEVLISILERMRPADVGRLCRTHLQMAEFCSDQRVFKRLIRVHFPEAPRLRDLTFKEQYMMLVSMQITYFRIPLVKNADDCDILDVDRIERGSPEDYNQSMVVIQGDPLPGESAWIYSRLNNDQADWRSFAFPTKEECLQEAWKTYLSDDQFGDSLTFEEFATRIEDEGDCVAAYQTQERQIVYRLNFIEAP